ncbi:hypothetical protein ABEB36_004979 [Hypothenemus hampei]|uniref:Cyclin-dependent kinase inhibitor domain-containing protein n=1 Tax=Hypothenemus hampei TaxID=57062 RepID=A0ABD1EWJ0_HYPHA
MSNREGQRQRNTLNGVRKRLTFDGCDDIENKRTTAAPETKELLCPKIETTMLEQMARWNFDFEHEIPLEGDWEWEKVQ